MHSVSLPSSDEPEDLKNIFQTSRIDRTNMALYYLPKKLNTLRARNELAHFSTLKSESMSAITKFSERLWFSNMTILQDVPDCNVYKFNNNDTKVSRDQTLKFSAPFDRRGWSKRGAEKLKIRGLKKIKKLGDAK